jgi:two-component system response regulator LytT
MTLKALIVDDEKLARDELQYLLSSFEDVEVVAQGRNGIEAIELVPRLEPDVLFLDVQMPGLDGFAVLRKLLDKSREITLPQVVFATAFDKYAVRAFEVNAVDYLLKPFDRARLEQALGRVRARLQNASAGTHESAGGAPSFSREQLESLIRLIEQQGGSTGTARPTSKIVVQAGTRMLLVAGGPIEVPHSRGAAGSAGSPDVLACAPVLRGEHQPHQGSRAVVQIELPTADE